MSRIGLALVEDHLRLMTAPTVWGRIAVWAAICAALLLGWGWIGAGLSWLTALGEAVILVRLPEAAAPWLLMATAGVALLLTVAARARPGARQIGRVRTGVLIGAGALVAATPLLTFIGARGYQGESGFGFIEINPWWSLAMSALTVAGILVAGLVAVLGAEPPVRRRIVVLLLAMASLLAVMQLANDRAFDLPVLATPMLAGAAALAVAIILPAAVLLLGALVVAGRQRANAGPAS